jgi:hypothetical protein
MHFGKTESPACGYARVNNGAGRDVVRKKMDRWVVYVGIILGISVLLALFVVPYFATRPLSRDELMHKAGKP